jgi:hypothetical protein
MLQGGIKWVATLCFLSMAWFAPKDRLSWRLYALQWTGDLIAKQCAQDVKGLECFAYSVPQDHFQLDGDARGTAHMYFMLHRARQPSQAKGFLLVNFGGPGSEVASNLQAGIQAGYFPDEILDHFHLIGLDPRGTGRSAFAADLQKCTHK